MMVFLLAPGLFAVHLIWSTVLIMPGDPYSRHDNPQLGLTLIGLLVFTWFFWRCVFPYGMHVVGLYNPFYRQKGGSKVLRLWVKINEWLDIQRFGIEPSGGWAGWLEVISHRFRTGDMFFGRPKFMLRPIGLTTEKHFVTIASPGSGKSVGAVVPNLCVHEGPVLCIDPVGELAALTAPRRGKMPGFGVKGMGQAVFILDPFKLDILSYLGMESACYNVFDEMGAIAANNPDGVVRYAGLVADAMVDLSKAKDPYFDKAAQSFLKGLILFIFSHEPPERRNLVRLRELMTIGDREGYAEEERLGHIKSGDGWTPFDVLLGEMEHCKGQPYDMLINGEGASLKKMGDKQMGAVVTTAHEHTSFLDSPEIRRISMKSDFLLEHLKGGWTSIYVCVPLSAAAGKEGRWLRMFVLLTIAMMESVKKPPDPPLLMVIDEFPNLGYLERIDAVGPTMRKYGVRLWVIGQNLGQFKAVYPHTWENFIGSSDAIQFMAVTDPTTVEFLMKRLGQHVVRKRKRVGRQQMEYEVRPVRDEQELGQMLSKEHKMQIIWRGNKRPMLLKITPYFEYLPWYLYSADPRGRYREKLKRRFWRGIFR
jgi:type IV secretion system protein VirD4